MCFGRRPIAVETRFFPSLSQSAQECPGHVLFRVLMTSKTVVSDGVHGDDLWIGVLFFFSSLFLVDMLGFFCLKL